MYLPKRDVNVKQIMIQSSYRNKCAERRDNELT